MSAQELDEAVKAEVSSQYGSAIQLGLRYILVANAFFSNNIDIDRLRDELDIGKLGRDGKAV